MSRVQPNRNVSPPPPEEFEEPMPVYDLSPEPADKNLDGLGSLLFHIHSSYMNLIGFRESTSLQFYSHVIVATSIHQLWCFPRKKRVYVIPKFKIVDAAFTLGPRSIPKLVWFLLTLAIILIGVGTANGGCSKCDKSYYYYNSNCDNSGACASLVIGCLILVFPVPALILVPIIWKWHYIYLDVKTPARKFFNFGGYERHPFRFKKIGFDTRMVNEANFDEFYLIEYVYGSLGKGGAPVTDEAHLISHFNHGAISMPMVPLNANNAIGSFMDGLKQRKGGSGVVGYAEV